MEANRDLDAQIADIVGEKYCHHELEDAGRKCKHCGCNRTHWEPKWGRISPPSFFSKDAAMAIWAGEKVRLFQHYSLSQTDDGTWVFLNDRGFWRTGKALAEGSTFPLAVCAAILKIHEPT